MPQATIVTRSTVARSRSPVGQRDLPLERADVALEGLGNHDRLLEDLLLHVVAVIALLDRGRRRAGFDDLALDRLVLAVEDLDALAADDRPVALVEIGDALGQRRHRERVRAEVIFAVAIADRQRRTHARADHQIGMVAEQEGDGEGAVKARQDGRDRVLRRRATLDLASDQMGDDFGVGLALELAPVGDQLVAQRLEVLDDAVVDQRHRPDDVRMGVVDGRRAVGRPARVGDADGRRRAAPGASSRARLSSLPSARRRTSSPWSIVQMPALS